MTAIVKIFVPVRTDTAFDDIARYVHPVYTLSVGGVDDCDGLGMLVPNMMSLRMSLFVLLEILESFEMLVADLTCMRLERDMDTKVGGDMVSLGAGRVAVLPDRGMAGLCF